MDRKVHLLGPLAKFGELWEIQASSVADIFKLIECQEPEFRAFLIEAARLGMDIGVVGPTFEVEEPYELLLNNLGSEEVYISLIPAGSGKGWGKILAGVVLIIVGVALGFEPKTIKGGFGLLAASTGVSLALQGVTQLLAKTPDSDKEEKDLGIFDGPEPTLKQGQPVPLLYGRMLVGGAPIHVNLTLPTNNLLTYSLPTLNPITGNENGELNFSDNTTEEEAWENFYANLNSFLNISIDGIF